MILGTEARVRPMVELVERSTDIVLAKRGTWPSHDHRDRGHFLTPRLYPTAAFDAWQPASSYAMSPVDSYYSYEETYEVASESM
jgi:hypothetical protein